jgi:hypothetical protein
MLIVSAFPGGSAMHRFGKETVFATYRVKKGKEAGFLRLLARHWPTLRRLGFTNGEKALVFLGKDAKKRPTVVEIFTWKSGGAVLKAHHHPEVAAIWEAMPAFLEARDGQRPWDFPHYRPVALRARA